MNNQWEGLAVRWNRLVPPLRPHQNVVALMQSVVPSGPEPVLLLGATPELATAFRPLQAVDKNPAMIQAVWPGNTQDRQITTGNWLSIEHASATFRAVVGDGSLNVLSDANAVSHLLERLPNWLVNNGIFICRVFVRPQSPVTTHDLFAILNAERRLNFHAFKWMMAFHLAAQSGSSVYVRDILSLFKRLCPDPLKTESTCGWSIAEMETIQAYADSPEVLFFPTQLELEHLCPPTWGQRWETTMGYDLAEQCPIWVVQPI